ncbi:dnaJ homolog subfamily C member 17 [Phlebotomus argentipes]|uniref:dnaJ homolog subfamily C member 17 n=1 Tax=Phlebotomus argentipes TaxID=94469 RepID=UPI002892B040|nr:dnaJ homolog subfamily C member 17 [Phlebotomus argentipes]
MVDIKKFTDVDLYGLLCVDTTASATEIRKAYRKKALDCHPDKNPDNPKAAELFHELAKALEILSDESARAAYDRVLNARKAAELRNRQLDSKRKKLKADLEERERAANSAANKRKSYNTEAKSPEEELKEEIERLRKEGSRLLEEEQELLRQQIHQTLNNSTQWDSSKHRIKIKWTAAKGDSSNGGYNEEVLRKYLQKFGDIEAIVVSGKKPGSAIVEYKTREASEMAIAYEKGNPENPLRLEWIGEPPKDNKSAPASANVTDKDFEDLVLRQMRQAEERKRLIEQMMKEDQEES